MIDLNLISEAYVIEVQSNEDNPSSRIIDWGYCCLSASFHTTLTSIMNELEAIEERQRQRTIGARARFRNVLESLILDLYIAWKTDKKLQLGISLSRDDYNSSNNYHKEIKFYHGLPLSFTDVRAAYNGLEQLGYMVPYEISKALCQ